jgi:hypothetical protein
MTLQQQLHPAEALHPAAPPRDFEVVIHVGYPKTASTWLQETVFGDPDSGFELISGDQPGSRARSVAAFVTVNSFCDDVKKARSFFEEGLRRCAGEQTIPVISDESLCGVPLNNGYSGRHIADRLHRAFPKARILIGIREQKAWAISCYRQYIMEQGTFPLEIFLGRGNEPMGFMPILHSDFLEYDRIVGYYQGLYGRENVLVLPMELLRKDPRGYLQSVLEFCECPGRIERPGDAAMVGLSALALEVRRRLNPLFPNSPLTPPPSTKMHRAQNKLIDAINRLAPRSWSAPLERRWKTVVARRYEGMFQDSNRRLAGLTDIDLAALGYDL